MHEYQAWLIIALLVMVWLLTESVASQMRALKEELFRLQGYLGLGEAAASEPSELVQRLAMDPSQRIQAIRAYRQETGVDLKTAKHAVETLAARHGEA